MESLSPDSLQPDPVNSLDRELDDARAAELCSLAMSGIDVREIESPESEPDDEAHFRSDKRSELSDVVVELPFSTLTQPASHFDGFVASAPEGSEEHAVATFLDSLGTHSKKKDYIEFDLNHFSIYIDMHNYRNELRPLQHLGGRAVKNMYFDGVLQFGGTKFYLRRVSFRRLPIGNYGHSKDTVGDQIWILSDLNERLGREVYYKLGSPAPEYRRFHAPFLWIADLAKHVIDYCEHCQEQKKRVGLYDFKSQFNTWMLGRHRSNVFRKWHNANKTVDFRGAVIANMDYIFGEANGLNPEITTWHNVWKEMKTLDYYQPNLGSRHPKDPVIGCPKDETPPKTIVTPYVHNLFSHLAFGQLLKQQAPVTSVETRKTRFIREAEGLSSHVETIRSPKRSSADQDSLISSIQKGDVISTLPDDIATTDTKWKRGSSTHSHDEYRWFGLVQQIHTRGDAKRSFDVLWLYQPIDTPCSVMKYPWNNELFLSDNCTCHPRIAKVQGHQVLATHEVEWFGSPATTAEFFVRQTYVASDCHWVSLRQAHLTCGGEEPEPSASYRVGDAVLINTQSEKLETFIVESFFEEEGKRYVRVRRLRRRREVDKTASLAPANELIYSQQFAEVVAKKIDRHCLVRVFRAGEEVPPPYNRDGTGDAFFITHQEVEVNGVIEYRPLTDSDLVSFNQGFHPIHDKVDKLHGLDLFCGGGNFGRGIEEGGVVEMKWANDIWEGAIHTYMANTEPGRCTPFLGSIDDLLSRALKGSSNTPRPGDVHFISAGSPCPGFSRLTIDKTTSHQRKNQSLVASFASFVELYRPFYGVLENVPSMVQSRGSRDPCVFSQLICALVGLGYQVRILFLDAWSFGSAQNRSRVFLSFTAPGLRTPNAPSASHSHPAHITSHRLGEMSCGRPLDSRKSVPTPFKFVSTRDAIGDLPDIQDGKADYCVGYPDHRLSIGYTHTMRKQLQLIPTHPYKMNFSKAWWGAPGLPRVMTAAEREIFPAVGTKRTERSSKGWGRFDPNGLLSTVTTVCTPSDARVGRANHWEQNRPITIMEARRAQGFLDHEVLVGTRGNQYKVVGNSVSRHVALVLGLAVREAWLGTLSDARMGANTLCRNKESLDMTISYTLDDDTLANSLHSLGLFTPPTSIEPSDNEASRKRSRSIRVEVFAKKRRHDFNPDDFLRTE